MKWVTWVKFSAMRAASPRPLTSRKAEKNVAPGVVHQDVDVAELGLDRGQEGVDRVGVADVQLGGDHPPAERLDRRRGGGQAVGVAVTDGDMGAEAGQGERRRPRRCPARRR